MITNVKEIEPLYDFVLVQPCEGSTITKSDLVVVQGTHTQEHNLAKVIAVGPGKIGMANDVLAFTAIVMSFFKQLLTKKSPLSDRFLDLIGEAMKRMHGTDPCVVPGDYVIIGRLTGVEVNYENTYCRLIKAYDCHAKVKFINDKLIEFKRFDQK